MMLSIFLVGSISFTGNDVYQNVSIYTSIFENISVVKSCTAVKNVKCLNSSGKL